MKKFLLFIVIAVVVLMAVPALVGIKVQEEYEAGIGRFKQGGYVLGVGDYQRGWFNSRATVELGFEIPASDGAPDVMKLTLVDHISHGPITALGTGLAGVKSKILVDGMSLFPEDFPAPIRTLIQLGGDGITTIDMPEVLLPESDERPQVEFGGLTGTLVFDAGIQNAEMKIVTPGLELSSEGASVVTMGEATMDSRSWQGASGLPLGSGSLSLKTLTFNDPESGKEMMLHGLSVEVDTEEQQGEVAGVVTYRFDTLDTGDGVYGPGVISLELHRLSAPVMLSLQQSIEEIRGQQLNQSQQGMAMMNVLMGSASEFLETDPGIQIKPFRLKTPDGTIEGNFTLDSKGLRWEHMGDTQVLLSKLEAGLSLKMPEKLLRTLLEVQAHGELEAEIERLSEEQGEALDIDQEQMDGMVAERVESQMQLLLDQGMVDLDGEYLLTTARLTEGILTVNGHPIPLAALGQ
ncbi:MAG: YdgA family protein [Gammaproteobacteria bacterium]|nr:YdgA family protein [Gammaproteobacteria bacterium]